VTDRKQSGAQDSDTRVAARPDVRFLLSSPQVFVALGFGAGLAPVAPGTAGSLLAIPLALALHKLPFGWQIGVLAAMCLIGFWICETAGTRLRDPDHPAIVWDEVCGAAIVLLASPPGHGWFAASFVAFRVFDILKPWPIGAIDRRLRNGIGTMSDDLVAAVFAVAAIEILHRLAAPLVS
jgi:phosphatidylglycerophosphatase A